ncbi:MAG: hypothetical protein Q7Q71_06130 [Verrucomicrobiota bacterium JB023]|nr:hypothetical protein [Verrucomicrobiota bacterium JB023]
MTGAAGFTLVNSPAATLGEGAEAEVVVQFLASDLPATADERGTLTFLSNDEDTPAFSIALRAKVYSSQSDSDSDEINDTAEHLLAPLGFDPETAQADLVTTYYENAPAAGLYTSAQVATLYAPAPVIQRGASSGKFTLTMDWWQSTDLQEFFDLPVTPGQVSVDANGDVVVEIEGDETVEFFRVELE